MSILFASFVTVLVASLFFKDKVLPVVLGIIGSFVFFYGSEIGISIIGIVFACLALSQLHNEYFEEVN